jgi:hypothetical protein
MSLSNLSKLAADFESKIDLPVDMVGTDSPPVSRMPVSRMPVSRPPVSQQPISVQPHKDLMGSVKLDIHKFNRFVFMTLLENTQRELAQGIAHSLKRHGFDVDGAFIHKHLLDFGNYSEAENQFADSFKHILNQYSDKAIHYIINNLSW